MDFAKNLLADNVRVLKSQVTKTAYQGVAIAVISIIIASALVSYYLTSHVSLDGLVRAQTENYAFGFWIRFPSCSVSGGNTPARLSLIKPEQ